MQPLDTSTIRPAAQAQRLDHLLADGTAAPVPKGSRSRIPNYALDAAAEISGAVIEHFGGSLRGREDSGCRPRSPQLADGDQQTVPGGACKRVIC